MASIVPIIPDDHSDTTETTSSTSIPRRSHRSSFSSSDGGHFSSPKPHKANQASWEAMRSLRRDSGGRVGLEHFRLLRRVGSGDIGSVYLCQIRNPAVGSTQGFYAMKVVDREALAARKKLVRAEMEKEILCMLDHPFLPTLYAHFDASHFSCLVMDFCPGGDLYSARLKLPSRRFPISSAKFYAAETLLAVEYLHMMGIVYRDLKPENVLVREDGHIMLSDFDLSLKCDVVPKLLKQKLPFTHQKHTHKHHHKHHSLPTIPTCVGGPIQPVLYSCFSLRRHLSLRRSPSTITTTITEHADGHSTNNQNNVAVNYDSDCDVCNNNNNNNNNNRSGSVGRYFDRTEVVVEPIEARSRSFVGTHEYLAPEVISGQGHGSAVDWWTFGVILYELLFGTTPFKGQNNEETLRNILKQPLRFLVDHGSFTMSPKEREEMEMAKDLIRKLLVKNPKKRIGSVNGAVEIKRHEFFDGVNWALIRSVRPPVVPAEDAHNRKISLMMKKNGGGVGGDDRSSRPPALLVVPRVLSKKERDQPYQIPSNHHHNHHFDFF